MSFTVGYNHPAVVEVSTNGDIPYIDVMDIIGQGLDEKEILISPFTKVTSGKKNRFGIYLDEKKEAASYTLNVEKQELPILSDEEEKKLEHNILQDKENQKNNFAEYQNLKDKIGNLDEEYTRMSNVLQNVQNELYMTDDFKKIANLQIEEMNIQNRISEIQNEIAEKKAQSEKVASKIIEWKKNIGKVCMSKCRKRELEIEQNIQKEEVQFQQQEERENVVAETKQNVLENMEHFVNTAQSNTTTIKALFKRMDLLNKISQEGNFSYYNQYINDPNEFIEVQNNINDGIKVLVNDTKERFNLDINEKNINNILNNNGTSIASFFENLDNNYSNISLDSAKDVGNLYENAFKKGIFNKFSLIRADVDLKKLSNELKSISNRGKLRVLFDTITGKESINKARVETIQKSIQAINKRKEQLTEITMPNEYEKYDIHEMYVDMAIFLDENRDNIEYQGDMEGISKLMSNIEKAYIINQTKVDNIMDEKIGRRVYERLYPLDMKNKKKNKQDRINDVYKENEKFLVENGYVNTNETKLTNSTFSNIRVPECVMQMQQMMRKSKEVVTSIYSYLSNDKLNKNNELEKSAEEPIR